MRKISIVQPSKLSKIPSTKVAQAKYRKVLKLLGGVRSG